MSAATQRAPWWVTHRALPRLASAGRRMYVQATHRHCRVEFGAGVTVGPGFHLEIPDGGTFIAGPGVEFRRGFVCEIYGGGRVTVGAGTVFTYNVSLQCSTSIDIGARCAIGTGTVIVDGSHRFRDRDVPILDQGYDFRPITIGDGTMVSVHCTVINDIGPGSFVGANSVVTRPIPASSLALGTPARVVEDLAAAAPDAR